MYHAVMKSVFCRTAIVTLLSFPCLAQKPISSQINKYMSVEARLKRFSGAILVAKNGKIITSRGYGAANVEWSVPNQASTKFRIGSLTKQFTAMAIMILQEHRALNVSDPACKYVAECPLSWTPITLHELLNHSSGIPDFTELPDYPQTQALPATVEGLVNRFRNLPLHFTPGEKFEYSNSGYVLLGAIVEKVSGESYAHFLDKNIFRPLGMHNTGYDSNTTILPRRAAGYTGNAHEIKNATYIDMSVPFAAGGLYSNVGDLLIWDQALYSDTLVSKESIDAMFKPYHDMVGYGWAVGSLFHRRFLHHNGSVDGFVSNIARFPQDRVLVVVLSNLEQAPVDVITRDLAAIVFGDKYELPRKQTVVQLEPSAYEQYVGRYQITADIILTISRRGNHLFGQLSGQSAEEFELLPVSSTHWFCKEPPVEIVFSKEQNGHMDSLKLNGEYTGNRMN